MRKNRTGFIAAMLTLMLVCLPVLSAGAGERTAEGMAETAVLTVRYYVSGDEGKMAAEPYRAEMLRGSCYRVESPELELFTLTDPGQKFIEGSLEEDTEISVYYSDCRESAEYTVEYIGRDESSEKGLLFKDFLRPDRIPYAGDIYPVHIRLGRDGYKRRDREGRGAGPAGLCFQGLG